ncbi:hypothetical protein [Pleomorphomonas sp. PLEO]|uniref:hypothetical protein n=1 Tax=Pleomorphomonas sp. PLEO TaxID=3239306 RepID=UPI00351F4496
MARTLSCLAFLSMAAVGVSGLASPASALDAPSAAPQGAPVCLVGLGSGDGSPAWSELDVTASRSVDLDLAYGAGLTVACGTFGAPQSRPTAIGTPNRAADPSAKGDFGSL